MSTAELVRVDFHGDALEAVKQDDKVWVSLRRCCECLGVDVSAQLQKLRGKSWACVGEIPTQVAGDDQVRVYAMIDLQTLSMWLATIDERKVAAAVRPKLVRYQKECAAALERHFFPPADATPKPVGDIDLELLIRQQEANLATMRSLQAARQKLTVVEAEVADVRQVAEKAARRATAALQTAEQNCGWFTVLGYANLTGRRISREEAARAGTVISRRMRLAGMTKQRAVDTRYGTVGQYPEGMLEEYFSELDDGLYE